MNLKESVDLDVS